MDFVPVVVMAALVKKVVDLLKYATSGDMNAVVTQVVAWAVGIGLAFLAANTDFANNVVINGQALDTFNGWSLVFIGVALASFAGFGWDTLKALDDRNSAVVPNLLATPAVAHQPAIDPEPPH